MRPELARFVPGDELLDRGGKRARFTPGEVAPEDANERTTLQQDEIEGNSWNVPAGEADDEQPAAPRRRSEGWFRKGSSDRIHDDIHAAAVGQRFDAAPQV